MLYGVLNAAMFRHPSEPGEYVTWSEPDYLTEEEFLFLLEEDPASAAESNPQLIIFEVK